MACPTQLRVRMALAASAALHLAALAAFLLFARSEPPRPPPSVATERLVEIDVVEAPAAPASHPAPPLTSRAPPSRAERAPSRRADAPREPGFPSPPVEPAFGSWGSQASDDRPVRADAAPLALELPSGIARLYGVGSTEGPGAGHLVTPDDLPGPEAVREATRREVAAHVERVVADATARNRVAVGLVDDYFMEMKKALTKSAASPPRLRTMTDPLSAAVRSYTGGMRRFGRTGNPYEAPEPGAPRAPSDLGPLRDGTSLVPPSSSGSFLAGLLAGLFDSGVVALVEIRQSPDGRLLDVVLVSSSGLPAFDDFALESVPDAIGALGAPPEGGAGIHPDGVRSVWAFAGKIVYAQRMETSSDALYLLLLPLGIPAGFDETTGTIWVNKLDKPQFVCRVRLMAVY